MDVELEHQIQSAYEFQQYVTQMALYHLRLLGWDGRTVETIPFIGQILSPVEGIWVPSQDNILRVELVGMPYTLKSKIAFILGKEYENVLFYPPLVKAADFLALNAALSPKLARGIPEYIYGIAQSAQADMFFYLLRAYMGTGLKLDVPAGYEDPGLEKNLNELLDRITDDNLYLKEEELAKFRQEHGISEEIDDIDKFIRLIEALEVDLSILSIKDQHKLYDVFHIVLEEVDFYQWISVAQWVLSHKPAVDINVPLAIQPILTEALKARYKGLIEGTASGIYHQQIILCDEDLVSATMYLRTQLACGRIPAYEGIEQDLATLQPYFAKLQAHAIEGKCLNAVMLFIVRPYVSLERGPDKEGPIMKAAFLQHLWEQELRIYHDLLHPKRPVAVILIDASGTMENTVDLVINALVQLLKMAGIR